MPKDGQYMEEELGTCIGEELLWDMAVRLGTSWSYSGQGVLVSYSFISDSAAALQDGLC